MLDENFSIKKVRKDRRKEISEIKFSPCSSYLAVGAHDSMIYTYDAKGNFAPLKKLRGHHSTILHIDFSRDSKAIMTVSTVKISFLMRRSPTKFSTLTWLTDDKLNPLLRCAMNSGAPTLADSVGQFRESGHRALMEATLMRSTGRQTRRCWPAQTTLEK